MWRLRILISFLLTGINENQSSASGNIFGSEMVFSCSTGYSGQSARLLLSGMISFSFLVSLCQSLGFTG